MCSLLFSYSSYWIITPKFLECFGSTEGNECLDLAVLCGTGPLQTVKLQQFRLALHLASKQMHNDKYHILLYILLYLGIRAVTLTVIFPVLNAFKKYI